MPAILGFVGASVELCRRDCEKKGLDTRIALLARNVRQQLRAAYRQGTDMVENKSPRGRRRRYAPFSSLLNIPFCLLALLVGG